MFRKNKSVRPASKRGGKTHSKNKDKKQAPSIIPRVRALANREAKKDSLDFAGNYFANSEGGTENIGVVINGNLLSQFIVGVYSNILCKTDSPTDYANMLSLAYSVYNNWSQLGGYTSELPRPIACVWAALRSKTVGRFAFEVDMTPMVDNTLMFYAIFLQATGAQPYVITSTSASNGLFTSTTNTIPSFSANVFRTVQSNYGSRLSLVSIGPLVEKFKNDASVFAWDSALFPISPTGTGAPNTSALAGGSISQGFTFIREVSTVSLEVPIRCNWMAQLRLCTPVDYQNGIQYSGYNIVRRPGSSSGCTLPVCTLPGPLGYQLTKRLSGRVPVPDVGRGSSPPPLQLKLVPSYGLANNLLARLETIANVSGQSTQWANAWNVNDVSVFVAGLIRYAMSATAFVSAGCCVTSSTVMPLLNTANRTSNNLYESINLPQSIQDLLSAIRPYYDDKEGDLYPIMYDFDPSQFSTSFAYKGSSQFSGSVTAVTKYTVAATSALIQVWKQFELPFAQVTTLVPLSKFNRTCVDMTLQQSVTSSGSENSAAVNSATSRRPITDSVKKIIYSRMGAIGYEPGGNLNFQLGFQGGLGDHAVSKRQPYVFRMSGIESKNTFTTLSITDGLVLPGTEARQNPTVPGIVATPPPSFRAPLSVSTLDLPKPVDLGSYRGWGYKAMEALGSYATYGNYGGPGWTAGTRDATKMDMVGGKYVRAPVDQEDALYKMHDEAIYHAGSDASKQQAADAELATGLAKLPSRSKFGDLAYYFFSR